jgi:hypothetical protein
MSVRLRHAVGSGLLLAACSTVAPAPETAECSADTDCDTVAGEVCAPDTRVCVPGSAVPPRRDLAFDIQEPQGFRVEVDGCDCEVTPDTANNTLGIRRSDLAQTFQLAIYREPGTDPAMATPADVLPASIQLSATTRFSAGPVPPVIAYPSTEGDPENQVLVPTEARWPRYHPYDALPDQLADGGIVAWRSVPTSTAAPVWRLLRPLQTNPNKPCEQLEDGSWNDEVCIDLQSSIPDPNFCLPGVGECTTIGDPHFAYSFNYDASCDRELHGNVVRVDGMTLARIDGESVHDATLILRHLDTEAEDRLGTFALEPENPADRDHECNEHDRDDPDDDTGCVLPDEICDPGTRQCVLALAGRTAANATTDAAGKFSTQVYDYCEYETANLSLTRSFALTVTPIDATPSVDFTFDVPFAPLEDDLPRPTAVPADLCIPDWGIPTTATVTLHGEPVTVIGDAKQGYDCCDVSCLPATAEDAAATTELPSADSCDGGTGNGRPSAIVDTPLRDVLDPEVWEAAGCLPPLRGDDDRIGGIRSAPIDCEESCVLTGLAAGRDGGARDYTLRVEMPVGSFYRSKSYALPIDASSATTPQTIELEPRVLVRGHVLLDEDSCDAAAPADGDCGSEGAVVFAERLRMPSDDPGITFAPYFHQVPTFYDPLAGQRGEYVLPLDPGTYLLTALPVGSSAGGPAKIEVLEVPDGPDIQHDLLLERGVIVTLDLGASFDRSTQVVPLDRGSWRSLAHPGRVGDPTKSTVDLNALGECMSATGDGRCRIRRLIAGTSITGSQLGQVRFIARSDPGAGSCPPPPAGACPMPQ